MNLDVVFGVKYSVTALLSFSGRFLGGTYTLLHSVNGSLAITAWFAIFYFICETSQIDSYLADWCLAGMLKYLFISSVFVGVSFACLSAADDDSTDVTDVLQQKDGCVSIPTGFDVPPVFLTFYSDS